jgi:hypothetical protein
VQTGAYMSRTQWATVAILSAAVVVVFGCLGAYFLVYVTQGVPRWPSVLSDRSTDSPTDSLEFTAASGEADYGYRLCHQDVAEALTGLLEETAGVISASALDAQASCATAEELGLRARALELKTAHDGCPGPTDAHLQAAQGRLSSSLTEGMEAVADIDNFCAGTREGNWLSESGAHLERAREQETLADEELEAFYGAY